MASPGQSSVEEYGISGGADSQQAWPLASGDGDSPIWVDLSDLVVIEATGADATEFLQGQFCNDLAAVSAVQAQLSGYCTPKGRLLALPIVVGTEPGFRLLVSRSVSEAFIKRLSMFVMRADVTLEIKDECLCAGVISDANGQWGDAFAEISPAVDNLGSEPFFVATEENRQVIAWHPIELDGVSRQRRLIITTKTELLAHRKKHDSEVQAPMNLWRMGDIQQGVPSVVAGTSDAFVPQMVNLQLINALSFTKGCYPGQEIVARMQYLGKLKRHMQRFVSTVDDGVDAHGVAVAGDALVNGDDDNAGIVVDAVLSNGTIEVLAVVKVSADADAFTVNGISLTLAPLPYDLPSVGDTETESTGDLSCGDLS